MDNEFNGKIEICKQILQNNFVKTWNDITFRSHQDLTSEEIQQPTEANQALNLSVEKR